MVAVAIRKKMRQPGLFSFRIATTTKKNKKKRNLVCCFWSPADATKQTIVFEFSSEGAVVFGPHLHKITNTNVPSRVQGMATINTRKSTPF